MSMDYSGGDVRLEHLCEDAIVAGGSGQVAALYQDGYILYANCFEGDGSYTDRILFQDSTESALHLYSVMLTDCKLKMEYAGTGAFPYSD